MDALTQLKGAFMPIPSWSHSRLTDFEKCKYRTFLLHVEKIPEPQRELPKGKAEHANDRGTRVHEGCELFVKGEIDKLPVEAARSSFAEELDAMRQLYKTGCVELEGEWGMNRDWQKTGWRGQWVETDLDTVEQLIDNIDTPTTVTKMKKLPEFGKDTQIIQIGKKLYVWEPAWLRLKLDALVFCSPIEAIAIDYKTGRKFGNEVKHGEQLQLYQLVTFLRFPQLETVHTELWYIDQDDITSMTFSRKRGLLFKEKWDKRGNALTTATDFPPNPNPMSCKWCQYGPWNGGQCSVGKR